MSKLDDLAKLVVAIIEKKDSKKPKALDTVGTVTRVDGDYAYIRFAGSDDETPVKETITVKKGDKVQVRSSKGSAWIVGNETAPPTDDTLAKKAMSQANKAGQTAKKASDLTIVNDTLYYLASDQDEGVTVEDEGWTKEPQEVTESLPYLWAYHDYERGNGTHFTSEPVIIAMYAEDGKGIDTLTTYYALGTSTSTAPTTGWATSFTYLSGYYIWRKELITYDDGTTNWTTAVYDSGLTQSSSLSYDTAQYIWTETTGLTDVPTGQYVTEVPKASYRSNPTGGALLLRSAGLYLRYAAKTLVELVQAGLKIYEPNDSTYPSAQFLSSGAVIGKENGGNIQTTSSSIDFRNGTTTLADMTFSTSAYIGSGVTISSPSNGSFGNGELTIWARKAASGGVKAMAAAILTAGSYIFQLQESRDTTEKSGAYCNCDMEVDGSLIAGNIAHGSVSITPTANTPTSKSVSFGKTFPSTPNVIISAETSVPGSTVLECGATNISTTGFTAWVYRTNTTATVLHWIAIS